MSSVRKACRSRYGLTCCELPKDQTPTFGVTLPEIDRVTNYLGRSASLYFVSEKLTSQEYAEFVKKSQVFEQVFAKGVRTRLLTVPHGDHTACIFLTPGVGCSLEKSIRPNACRLYPFWFEPGLSKSNKSLIITDGIMKGACHGRALAKSESALFKLMGTSEDECREVVQQMLRDAALHERMMYSKP
jgi:Fe-S-cluster containining protein